LHFFFFISVAFGSMLCAPTLNVQVVRWEAVAVVGTYSCCTIFAWASLSQEANGFSRTSYLLWNSKFYGRVPENPTILDYELQEFSSQLHGLLSAFSFLLLSSHLRVLLNGSIHSDFPAKILCIFLVSPVFCSSHHNNRWYKVQIMKLLIRLFCSVSCYFLPILSTVFSGTAVLT